MPQKDIYIPFYSYYMNIRSLSGIILQSGATRPFQIRKKYMYSKTLKKPCGKRDEKMVFVIMFDEGYSLLISHLVQYLLFTRTLL